MPRRQLTSLRAPSAAAVTIAALALGACAGDGAGTDGSITAPVVTSSPGTTSPTTSTSTSSTSTSSTPPASTTTTSNARSTVATDLDVPWALAFLPDRSALVTLRDTAQLLHVAPGRGPRVLGTIPDVEPGGEGGLLGVAVSPDFSSDRHVFVYFTAAQDNRVVRLTFADGKATALTPVLTGIPRAGNHNGGRLAFGPDGYLYVATGDAGDGSRSQDRGSLGGKILRITKDGKAAPGNPSGSRVWSLGHRNVQGIAWDEDGTMYASEFGQNTWDELNLIEPGKNYGWPEVEGGAGRRGFTDPLAQWATSDASPSGIAVADGAVWMTALRGESMWRIPLSGNGIGTPQRLLEDRFGRLRDVVHGPDGRLWFLTSNTFRGSPAQDDDRLLAWPTSAFD